MEKELVKILVTLCVKSGMMNIPAVNEAKDAILKMINQPLLFALEKLSDKVLLRPKEWRAGQAWFNYAYEMYPEDTDCIRGTSNDCFYRDDKIGDFIAALARILNPKE